MADLLKRAIDRIIKLSPVVQISGVELHLGVLQIYSDVCDRIPSVVDDIKCEPRIVQELKSLMYCVKDTVSNELSSDDIIEMYQLCEYLLIDADNWFRYICNLDLYIYLLREGRVNSKLVSHMSNAMKNTVDTRLLEIASYRIKHVDIFTEDAKKKLRGELKSQTSHIMRNLYAFLVCHGYGGPKNKELAAKLYWQNWTENSDTWSLANYALMVEDGAGVQKDEKAATDLCRIGMEKKCSLCTYFYAWNLELGLGCTQDTEGARKLFWQNWIENSDVYSLRRYAQMLVDGRGGPRDKVQGQKLLYEHATYNV